jgi:signal transduction histidine kinase
MLLVSLVLIGGTSFLFGWLVELPYDATLNFRLSIFLALCLPFVYWPRCYEVVANLLIGSSLLTIFLIAAQTGGINSVTLMWPTALSVVALLLIGLRGTIFWFCMTLGCFLFLHYLTINHWVSGSNAHVFEHYNWGLLTVSVLTILLMVGVQMYDYLHALQMRQLQDSNQELKSTHEALVHIQNLRDEFVASVGHELRTPMNAILGFNGVLRDQIGQDARMIATVDHIHDATHQLLGLVNDVLDFSQLQAGKMQLHARPCDVTSLLTQTCAPWQQACSSSGGAMQSRRSLFCGRQRHWHHRCAKTENLPAIQPSR